MYFPFSYFSDSCFALIIRTAQPPELLTSTVRKAILELDQELPIDDLRPIQARIDDSLIARRAPAIFASVFAVIAQLLAAIGTYGVLSYAVAQRQSEIGVRMALGAHPGQIRNQFLSIGLRLLSGGVLVGIFGAWCAGRTMQSLIVDYSEVHGAVLGSSFFTMSIVVMCSCLLPAYRAARVDPVIALRAD